VITFQTIEVPARTPAAPTHHGLVVMAGATMKMGKITIETTSVVVRPSQRSSRSAVAEPITAPIAPAVRSTPKPASERPIGPGRTAKRGKIAPHAVDARFERPVHSAMVRSTLWLARYLTPSTMSVRIRVGGPVRSGRKAPTTRKSTPAPMR